MAVTNYQYELIKLYLAAFVRAPEKGGLDYWLAQIASGRSFDSILETVFNLDIVKTLYPATMDADAFVTAIYANVFGRAPDPEGLKYWTTQLEGTGGRGKLVMDMINAGLATVDGTPGKAYIVNRLKVSQSAVDFQNAQQTEFTPNFLKNLLQTVNADTLSVTSAQKAIDPSVTGIGIGAPSNAVSIAAATNGLSAAEIKAGVKVVVDLKGTNAVAGNYVELLIDNSPFPESVSYVLTAADIKAQVATVTTASNTVWGIDGPHSISALVRNTAGVKGNPGGQISVIVNQEAPFAPREPVEIAVAAGGINLSERNAGVAVKVFLANTAASVGDTVEVLLEGKSFSPSAVMVVSQADLDQGFVQVVVPPNANWGSDGDKQIAARLTDVAGNVGGIGGGIVVRLDQTAPVAFKGSLQIDAAVGGLSAAEKAADVLVKVNLNDQGAIVGDSLELLIDGKPFASSTLRRLSAEEIESKQAQVRILGDDAGWGSTDGVHVLSARVIDAAGNIGAAAGDLKVTVDTQAPTSQKASLSIPLASNGLNAAELASGVEVLVNLTDTNAVVGDVVELKMDGSPIGSGLSTVLNATQISSKTASIKIPNAALWGSDGLKTLNATIRDSAGNRGANSADFKVVVDTQAPNKMTVLPVVPAASAGINASEKSAGVSVKIDLAGTGALVDDKVEVSLAGASFTPPVLQNIQVQDVLNGFVMATIPANAAWGADGVKLLAARVIDAAGNIGPLSEALSVVLDTVAPNGPAAALQVAANTNGGLTPAERSGGVTVVADLTGASAVAGDQIEILIGGLSFATPVIKTLSAEEIAAKSVSLTIGTNDGWGSSGSKDLSARFIDTSGNLGSAGGKVSVTVLSPNPISNPLQIPAAVGGINPSEKANTILVTASLAGTNVQAGDAIELLINNKPFTNSTVHVISPSEIAAGAASLMIAAADAAWGTTDGERTISARILDTTGKIGNTGGSLKVILDSIPPASQNATLTAAAAQNGLNALEIANGVEVTVNLAGTNAVAGDVISFLLGGVPFSPVVNATISAIQASAKTAIVTIPKGVDWGEDGNKTLSVYITDSAGNQGLEGAAFNVLLDATAPGAPKESLLIPAAASNINLSEKNAGVQVKVDLNGTGALVGDKIEILINGASLPTPVYYSLLARDLLNAYAFVTIPANAAWGADGSKTIAARVIDVAGNVGAVSKSSTVVLDTIAPNGPASALQVAANADGGLTPAERSVGVAVVADLNGSTAVAGDKIEILIGGQSFATPVIKTLSDADLETKSVTLTIGTNDGWGVSGSKDLTARFIDTSGNIGSATGKVSVNVLTPNPISLPLQIPAAAGGINPIEKANPMVVTVSLAGTNVQAGDAIELLIASKPFTNSTLHVISASEISAGFADLSIAGGDSAWGTVDGERSIAARIIDTTGKVGLSGGTVKVTLDSVAPASQNLTLTVASALNGLNAAKLAAGVEVSVGLTGTNAVAGDTVTLLLGTDTKTPLVSQTLTSAQIGAKSAIITIPSSAVWGADGVKTLSAFITDVAGNQGLAGGALNVLVDATVPNAPLNSIQIPAATNRINSAEKQSGVVVTVDLTGTNAASGDKIEILLAGTSFSTPILQTITTADITNKLVNVVMPSTANWGADGIKLVSARVIDTAGNLGAASAAIAVETDFTVPSQFKGTVQIDAAVGGLSASEKASDLAVKLNLTGQNLELGDSIELLIDGKPFGASTLHLLTADELNTKQAQLLIRGGDVGWGTTDGIRVVTARVIDSAGNIGVAGGELKVTVDSQAPASQNTIISIPAATNGLSAAEVQAGVDVAISLTGSNAVAGDTVVLLLDGLPIGSGVSTTLTATQVSAKTVTIRIPNGSYWGSDGVKTINAYIRDSAGNVGANSNDVSVVLDTSAPSKPSSVPTVPAASSNINASEKSAGVLVKVDLAGTGALAGDKLEIVLNGASLTPPVMQTIQIQDLLNGFVSATIPSTAAWGADGSKTIAARVIDSAGNVGALSDSLTVVLDTIAPSGPTATLQVAANANGGLTPAERAAGVAVVADLTGTSAVAGDQIEILIGGLSFATPVIKTLSAAEVSAKSVTLNIGTNDGWGSSGSKDLTARFIDASGNAGSAGGKVSVIVLSPNPISSPLQIPVAVGGINPTEKANAMAVTANLAGTNVQAGDAIELLIDGKLFANSTLHVISAAEVSAGTASLSITGGDSAWGSVDGDRTITARIIDMSGKVGVSGGSVKVTLDSIAPLSQNILLTVPAALNGLNASELAAGVSVTVNLTGTNAAAGDVVTLLLGGVAFTPLVSLTLSSAQITAKSAVITIPGTTNWGPDGNKTLSAYITDTAGNQGLPGGALSVVVDALVPAAPTNPIAIPAATNSINALEKQNGVTVFVDLTGTNAASGDKIEILMAGVPFSVPVLQTVTTTDIANNLVSVVIPSTASWGSDGIKLISARVVDIAGNLGPASPALSVNLDTLAPSGPTNLLQVPANSGGGIDPAERAAGVNVTIDLTGTTATVGDTVEVLIGGASFQTPISKVLDMNDLLNRIVTMTIGTNSGWGPDGNKILSVRFIDSAGNYGSAGGAVTVNLDATPPGATPTPLVVAAAAGGLNGLEKNAGVDVQIDLTSTGVVAGDTVSILLDGLPFSTPVTQTISAAQVLAKSALVTIPGSANWGADGNKVLTAMFIDVLGNAGAVGGAVTIALDTIAPLAPSNSVSVAVAGNGINAAEKNAGVTVLVDLTGTGAVVGDRAEILIGGVSFPTPVVQNISAADISNGSITLTIPGNAVWGSDGIKTLAARVLDFTGNPGPLGGAISVNLDTTAPNATPTTLVVPAAAGSIDNAEKAAGVNVNVDLTGTGVVAGDQVEILVGGSSFTIPVLHTITAGEIAAKLTTATILQNSGWGSDNDKVFTARFIDVAGNVGAAGGAITVTMQDTTPPNAPANQVYVPAASNGISLAEKNAGVAVTGYLAGTFAVAGDIVSVLIDGSSFANPVTHVLSAGEIAGGSFTVTIPSNAGWGSDGSHVLSMRVTDVAGNVGNAGGALTVSLDSIAPSAPINPLTAAVASNGINAVEKNAGVVAVVDLAGTGAVLSDRVEILLGGNPFTIPVQYSINASDLSAGFVNVTIPSNAGWGADGVKTLSARVIDVAGNIGVAGGSLTTTMETTIPTAAGLPIYNDVDNNGFISVSDTYVFTISEATNKALGLANMQVNNGHSFGAGASVSWSPDGTQLTLTLGAGTTVALGDIISLIGVSDAAGNTNSLSFTI